MNDNLFDKYVIKSGDNIYSIGREYNTNPQLLALINGLNIDDYIYSGQEIYIPKKGYSFYLTKFGDNLEDVLSLFNTNFDDFIKLNRSILLDENQLFVYKG